LIRLQKQDGVLSSVYDASAAKYTLHGYSYCDPGTRSITTTLPPPLAVVTKMAHTDDSVECVLCQLAPHWR